MATWSYPDPPRPPRGLAFLRAFGPGAVLASATIGAGETILAVRAGAWGGYDLLWLVLIASFTKSFLLLYLLGRYSALTGESIWRGFVRLNPVFAFALWILMALSFLWFGAFASAGQARSLLLALALAALEVYRAERGAAAVALLDDLDSELDEERAGAVCAEVARRGQAWVTTAHAGWASSLRPFGRLYEVSGGAVRCA